MCWKNWIIKLIVVALLQVALTTTVVAHGLSKPAVIPGRGGDFTLHSFDGPVSLKQFRGKIVLMFFGYTSCRDICPTTLAVLSHVFSKLSARDLERVTALFISLDPARDTPELLRQYTGYFHPNIIGVTDDVKVLEQLTENYGVDFHGRAKASSPLGYKIDHEFDILVVNSVGQLLDTRIRPATSSDDILAYLKQLLGKSQ